MSGHFKMHTKSSKRENIQKRCNGMRNNFFYFSEKRFSTSKSLKYKNKISFSCIQSDRYSINQFT